MDQQKARNYGMSLSNEVNMTTCYKHCKHFFEKCKSIHFNVLIAYWMMAGYLGPVDSIEEAYQKGFDILLDLTYQEEGMLKPSVMDPEMKNKPSVMDPEIAEMIEFKASTNSEPIPCSRHKGLCIMEKLGFVDLVDLVKLGDFVVLTDGMLKSVPKIIEEQYLISDSATTTDGMLKSVPKIIEEQYLISDSATTTDGMLKSVPEITEEQYLISDGATTTKHSKETVLLVDGNHLSRQVFHSPRKLRYLAYFKPRPRSLNLLLNKVTQLLSVLLLRDCEWLKKIDFSLKKFKKLTVLEISGLIHVRDVATIPLEEISDLAQLQCLNLSDLLIEELPNDFFSKLVDLQWVILRGCSKLLSLPTIKLLNKLKMLDLSYCSALKRIATAVLQNSDLQMLDFSYTSMSSIPTLKVTPKLTHLFLKNAKVSVLSSLKQVGSLEVLDLSGAESVIEIKQLAGNKNLTVLDLSRTKITSIDFLPDLIHLRDLILQKCISLEKLPAMEKLTKLEVLDLSGCEKLGDLPEGLINLKSLKELNLSLTKVNHLPSFANLTMLRKLSLRGLELDSLESLASLSNLEELDLKGLQIIPPQDLTFDFVQDLVNLQILDLSQTPVAQLPDLSKLQKLRKLILENCQRLEAVPDLQPLTNLETLNLSLPDRSTINNCQAETEIEDQRAFYLSVPSSLRKLVLKNRTGLQNLLPLTSLGKLEDLDLRGTDVGKIAYDDMDQVKRVQLPAKIGLSGVCLSTMRVRQEAIDWKGNHPGHLQGEVSDDTEIQIVSTIGNKSSMSAGANQFFHLKESGNQGSWEAFIHQFSVSLPPKGGKDEVICLDGDEFILRNDLSWAIRLLNLKLKGKSVEIHGFSGAPDDIQNILQEAKADNVAFVANDFLFTPYNLCSEAMKVCCVRRCRKMKSVLTGEGENGIIAKCPERLVLSDVVDLESIYSAKMSSESIEALKHLHIDCCPSLTKVIIASPVPEKLETLHVKFCNKLVTLFEGNVSLSNLQELILFELPRLDSIKVDLPSLKSLSISQCPELKMKSVLTGEGENGIIAKCPERLVLSNVVDLESIYSAKMSSESIEALKHLHIDCCPSLTKVIIASPVPEKLETLHVKFCNKLVTLFEGNTSLSNLQELILFELPRLDSIKADLPSLKSLSISQCPELKTLFNNNASSSSSLSRLHKLQKLRLFELHKLESIGADLPKLENLNIGQCPVLKNVQIVVDSARTSLTQVFLDSCPCLEHVLPSSPLLEKLKVLKISSCSGLVNLSDNAGASSPSLPKLETVCIKFCDKLQTLFEQNVSLINLQKLSVFELPKLEGIEADFPSLEALNIGQCPVLKNLDRVVKSASSCLTRVCVDSCSGLKHALPSSPVLEKLQVLKISSCNELVTLFHNTGSSSSLSHKLHNLQARLHSCSGLKQNVSLISLQKLSVLELPKLEGIEADFPSLEALNIGQCPVLENLDRVVISASSCLTRVCVDSCSGLKHALPSSPVLEKLQVLEISSCNELVTLFHNTGSSSSSSHKLHNLQTLRLRNLPKLKSIGGELSLAPNCVLDPSLPPSIRQQIRIPEQ